MGFSAFAAPQSTTTVEHPFKIEIGAWFPTFSESGISKKTGVSYALGYTFLKAANGTPAAGGFLELELRGNTYTVGTPTGDADITLGQLLINANAQTSDGKLFYGLHFGAGKGEAKSGGATYSDDDTRFVYGAQVGYHFSPNVYGIVRYSTTNESLYRGVTVGVGYRF